MRGSVAIRKEVEYTFKLLHLHKKNHATIIKDYPTYLGMMQKIKDYATWGEASIETIALLLSKKGFLKGNRRLTDNYVKENLGWDSINSFAEAIAKEKIDLWKLPNLKPVFRLHPPKGGFHGSIKKPYPKGELGYRGEDINQLIKKMI
ncbi:MAG: 50S ribosomal protein L30 [Candidatus Bathyarchaeota archaeon]|nr:MAG: 50S ribosomal protein L30 [Candidatus Bathyarchaeota archaeon]